MGNRDIVILECTESKHRHYTTTRNKKKNPTKLQIKKYNPVLRRHTLYKEVK
ncbi:MAG: 50S ribosomal protein L33 [Candidatus Lernaella stagnicola]|nr:50S ribosomal protein L33 [Candidatus Lernaella stagnicola]